MIKAEFVATISAVANIVLTHVTSHAFSPGDLHNFHSISVNEIAERDLTGHHLLIDVPLRMLKKCVSKIHTAVKKNWRFVNVCYIFNT